MADETLVVHQLVGGVPPGNTVTVSEAYGAWLKKQGYATPVGGNAAGHDGTFDTDVAAAQDVTLAANREAAGGAQTLIADAQERVERTGSRDTVAKTRGNAKVDTAVSTDSASVVKTP